MYEYKDFLISLTHGLAGLLRKRAREQDRNDREAFKESEAGIIERGYTEDVTSLDSGTLTARALHSRISVFLFLSSS